MRRSILRLKKRWIKVFTIGVFSLSLLTTTSITAFYGMFTSKIYPNIYIAGINMGGLSIDEATALLSSNIAIPKNIVLEESGQILNVDTQKIGLSYDFTKSAQSAFNLTRSGNFLTDLRERLNLIFYPKFIGLNTNIDDNNLNKIISVVSGQISLEPIEPSFKVIDGKIVIDGGKPGAEVDSAMLKKAILNNLSFAKTETLQVPITNIDHTLSSEDKEVLKSRLEKYIGKSIQLKFESNIYTLTDSDMLKMVDLKSGFSDQAIEGVVNDISSKINRDPQNPKFNFKGGRVNEFQPALDGVRTNKEEFKNLLIYYLTRIENDSDKVISFNIPVLLTAPDITTDKANDFGIKELIGRGVSTYFHSIPSRVHNIALATSRINGTLVAPGETFSFNDTLGDVSQFTGYQQAYIISDGKTILGDGGGVCQVSTTLFRSVLNAGLPITERQAHAYRVGYYEQNSPPGLDATVYGPSPDFKFKNDTATYILIEAKADIKNYSLVFELYGTNDGRVATVSKPVVTNVTAPPDDSYQDDPTIPSGKVKQIDYRAWGAKVVFDYSVKRDGEEIYKKTFISDYRPWQAVYLRGAGSAI